MLRMLSKQQSECKKLFCAAMLVKCLYAPAAVSANCGLSPDCIVLTCCCCLPNALALLLEQEPEPNDFENLVVALGQNTVDKNKFKTSTRFYFFLSPFCTMQSESLFLHAALVFELKVAG